jgi:flagellar assembly factor FliW
VPDYQVRIPRSELTPLDVADVRQAQVVVVVGTNGTSLTLNLKAPIVINLEARTGRQVVASGELPLQYELTSVRPPLKKSA